jgi:hypothetical protein
MAPAPSVPGGIAPTRLITGTFLGIDHWSDGEAARFQAELRTLTEDHWRQLVRDMHGIGIDTLVFQQCSCSRDGWGKGRAYYRSKARLRFDWMRGDTFGAVVSEATALGMTVFYGAGDMYSPEPYRHAAAVWADAEITVNEILGLYGDLPSFGGWYWTWEYSPSSLPGRDSLREFVPRLRAIRDCPILIAPNADRLMVPTVLADIDVDIIAYQDTVGLGVCPDAFGRHARAGRHLSLDRLPFLYEALKYAHDAWQPADAATPGYWNHYTRPRGRTALWNDLEVWEFDHRLSLHPTELSRVVSQLDLTAPYVDKQIIFQYPGLMQHPDHPVPVGGERARTLYEEYAAYRENLLRGGRQ